MDIPIILVKIFVLGSCVSAIILCVLGLASIVPLLTSSSKFGNGNDPMVCPPPGFGDIFQRWLYPSVIENLSFPFAHRCFNHNAADANSPFNGWKETDPNITKQFYDDLRTDRWILEATCSIS
eukprot:741941_1